MPRRTDNDRTIFILCEDLQTAERLSKWLPGAIKRLGLVSPGPQRTMTGGLLITVRQPDPRPTKAKKRRRSTRA